MGQIIYEASECYPNDGKHWEVFTTESFVGKSCEYGYPDLCGKPAFMKTPYGHLGFPGELFSCKEHYKAMSHCQYGRAVEIFDHYNKGIGGSGLVELSF